MLRNAAALAASLWPDCYCAGGAVRLVLCDGTAPGGDLAEAASRGGIEVALLDLPEALCALQCDLALTVAGETNAAPSGLPVLAAGAEGPSLRPGHRRDPFAFLHHAGTARFAPASAEALARALLAPPANAAERRKLIQFQSESMDVRVWRFEYRLLLRLIGEASPLAAAAAGDDWAEGRTLLADGAAAALEALRAEYARADLLALIYGERWRSILASRSLMLLLTSVMSGLLGTLVPALALVTIPVQIATSVLIFADRRFAAGRRWREKWLEYRSYAESLRIARFCLLAGAAVEDRDSAAWTGWRLRRVLRAGRPAVGAADPAAALWYLERAVIGGQIAYHHAAASRFGSLDRRLARAATVALWLAMGLAALFGAGAIWGTSLWGVKLRAAISLALSAAPGLYGAVNSLRGQLDVTRQARRSERIAAGLIQLRADMAGCQPSAPLARAAAERAAHIMQDDLSTWSHVMEVI